MCHGNSDLTGTAMTNCSLKKHISQWIQLSDHFDSGARYLSETRTKQVRVLLTTQDMLPPGEVVGQVCRLSQGVSLRRFTHLEVRT